MFRERAITFVSRYAKGESYERHETDPPLRVVRDEPVELDDVGVAKLGDYASLSEEVCHLLGTDISPLHS